MLFNNDEDMMVLIRFHHQKHEKSTKNNQCDPYGKLDNYDLFRIPLRFVFTVKI